MNKNLLALMKQTAATRFKDQKITSAKSKRANVNKQNVNKQTITKQTITKQTTKSSSSKKVKIKNPKPKELSLREEYEILQEQRNKVIEEIRDDLYKYRRRDYNVLDEMGFLTKETTPFFIFDSEKEVKNRMAAYKEVIDKGAEALVEEATKGTSGLIHMFDNTILSELDATLRQDIVDQFEFASLEDKMDFLKDAFKYLREDYEEIRNGFETLHGREIAEEIATLLRFRMEDNSEEHQEVVEKLYQDYRYK